MEEDESKADQNALYKKLLALNYYETIEPQDYEEPPRPLRKVPQTFESVEVTYFRSLSAESLSLVDLAIRTARPI